MFYGDIKWDVETYKCDTEILILESLEYLAIETREHSFLCGDSHLGFFAFHFLRFGK